MKDVAAWKWGVLIGAGVLSIVVWVFVLGGRERVEFADSIKLIDVETGQIYQFSTKKQLFIPAKSPETGNRTLFSVWEDVDGTWFVDRRMLGSLRENTDVKVTIDWSSGKVETNGKEIQRVN